MGIAKDLQKSLCLVAISKIRSFFPK